MDDKNKRPIIVHRITEAVENHDGRE